MGGNNCKNAPGQGDPGSDDPNCRMEGYTETCFESAYGKPICNRKRCWDFKTQYKDRDFSPWASCESNPQGTDPPKDLMNMWCDYIKSQGKTNAYCRGDIDREGFFGALFNVLVDLIRDGYDLWGWVICHTLGYLPYVGDWLCAVGNNMFYVVMIAIVLILVFLLIDFVLLPILEFSDDIKDLRRK